MSSQHSARQLAFVVDASGAQPTGDLMAMMQLARQFSDEWIPATWIVDSPSIADAIRPASTEAALFDWAAQWHGQGRASGNISIELLRSLKTAGLMVSAVYVEGARAVRGEERRLASLGVRAVVDRASSELSRPMPHGLWHFGVDAALPRRRSWNAWFLHAGDGWIRNARSLSIAVVNVRQLRSCGTRGAKKIARSIQRAARQIRHGDLDVRTIGQLSAQRTQRFAVRPQRSILRAA